MEYFVYMNFLMMLNAIGREPFTAAVNYMSLEGFARLLTFWLTGVWV